MLYHRPWVPAASETFIQDLARATLAQPSGAIADAIERLAGNNRQIHERDCVNLNPATNAMNPRAEALLASGIGTRPSLGYPGDKYEMGLEAIERIEVIAAALAAEIFQARYVEIRVASGAMANLSVFMAAAKPGDRIIAPPATIGGHVTHHTEGAAGLYGLEIHSAPVDGANFTVDLEALAKMARALRPKLITLGGSLNLYPHPVREVRRIADSVGAVLMFDAAHLSGMIAGGGWPNPLVEGAHAMTMSTYKSLGGPPSGLILANDAGLAERLEKIAYPGLTANFDAAKSAALAMTLLDWRDCGQDYARRMAATASALAEALAGEGVAVHRGAKGFTQSHQFALEAAAYGGGQTAAKKLRRANILSCGIGLPIAELAGDLNGLRFGTPEIARWGMGPGDMPTLARFIARALAGNQPPESLAAEVSAFRRQFDKLHFIRP